MNIPEDMTDLRRRMLEVWAELREGRDVKNAKHLNGVFREVIRSAAVQLRAAALNEEKHSVPFVK